MFYKNARIFASDFTFRKGAFSVTDGVFTSVFPGEVPDDAIDLKGATVIPGLVDIHARSRANLKSAALRLAALGITSFVPALPYTLDEGSLAEAAELSENRPESGARLLGIHLEGPVEPDFEAFRSLYKASSGLIRIAQVSPENPGVISFIEKACRLCTISAAHTQADYSHARDGFAAGATLLSELYRDMPDMLPQAPGVIPAAVENPTVKAELVCGGEAAHPAMVRLAFSMFGPGRVILVSGPTADLFQCMKNAVTQGIPEEDAVRAATFTPACAINRHKEVGMISPGRRADFIICRPDYTGKRVFIGGAEI